jgi:hypothetical protein
VEIVVSAKVKLAQSRQVVHVKQNKTVELNSAAAWG